MRTPVAFVDANVLFSKTLCDWLFLLRLETGGGMFVLSSSQDSLTELLYHMRRKRPTADGELTARRRLLIETSLDEVLDSFPGSSSFPGLDEHDSHIHAAAIASQARYMITDDKGFAKIDPDELPYEVHSTDSFLMLVAANAPRAVDAVILKQIAHFQKRGQSKALDVALRDAGCLLFAECVREHTQKLALGASTHGLAREIMQTSASPNEEQLQALVPQSGALTSPSE